MAPDRHPNRSGVTVNRIAEYMTARRMRAVRAHPGGSRPRRARAALGRDQATGPAHEVSQHRKLLERQRQIAGPARRLVTGRVERQLTHPQD